MLGTLERACRKIFQQAPECTFFGQSAGYPGLSPAGSGSSECTPGACYFRRASGCFQFASELGLCNLSLEARFVILVVKLQDILEAYFVTFEINLFDQS